MIQTTVLTRLGLELAAVPQEPSVAKKRFEGLKDYGQKMAAKDEFPTVPVVGGAGGLLLLIALFVLVRRRPDPPAEPSGPAPDSTTSNKPPRFVSRKPRRPLPQPLARIEPASKGWLLPDGLAGEPAPCEVALVTPDALVVLVRRSQAPVYPEAPAFLVISNAGAARSVQAVTVRETAETPEGWRVTVAAATGRVGVILSPGIRVESALAAVAEVAREGHRRPIIGRVTAIGLDGVTFEPAQPINLGEGMRVIFDPLPGAAEVAVECEVVRVISHSSGKKPVIANFRTHLLEEVMALRVAVATMLAAPESTPEIALDEPAAVAPPAREPSTAAVAPRS